MAALELGVSVPCIAAAVDARLMLAFGVSDGGAQAF